MTVGTSHYTVVGGFCKLTKTHFTVTDQVIWVLWVTTGLVTNPPGAPIGNGLWLAIPAGKRVRAGTPLDIFDGTLEVPAKQFYPATHPVLGTATLRKRLAGGTFQWRETDGTEIRGSWTCR